MPSAGHFAIPDLTLGIVNSGCSALTFVRFLSIGFFTAFHGAAPARMSHETM
jgi:hypothetical protein